MEKDVTKLYTNTEPINKEKVAIAIKELYRHCNTSASLPGEFWKDKPSPSRDPDIIFVDGPNELEEVIDVEEGFFNASAFNEVAYFINRRGVGLKDRMHSVVGQIFSFTKKLNSKALINRWEGPMMLAIDHIYDDKPNRAYENKWEDLAKQIWDNSYAVFTFINKCYVVNRPNYISGNSRGFHNKTGPSLTFRDGSEIYCWEGIKVAKEHLLNPKGMTLKEIHQHNSRKHYLIDMVGVDHYLDLVKAWRVPEVKNRFKKFYSFAKMVLPGYDEPEERDRFGFKKEMERGYGSSYKDKAYGVTISLQKVNGEFGLMFKEDQWGKIYHFPYSEHPFDMEYSSGIFEEADRELYDLFDLRETFSRGCRKLKLTYQDRKFRLKSSGYDEGFRSCRHDVAPSWFKAKMFRGEEALYENEEYAILYKDGKLSYAGDIEQGGSCISKDEPLKPIRSRNSLFSGYENLPTYQFEIDLESDSWEGLLEKWAKFSFEWLGLHEDSTRIP